MSALTAKTANSLYHLPQKIYPENKINHQIEKILKIIKKVKSLNNNYEKFFCNGTSLLLKMNINFINQLCVNLSQLEIDTGPVFSNHYDMHPHNVLFLGSKPIGLLDFDSIVEIPIGFSIAYSALKQCRQLIAHNQDLDTTSQIGKEYIDSILENLKVDDIKWINNFKALAQIETLRRIALILQLNLEGNNLWNKVLPVLISNLYEAEKMFD